MQNIVLYIRTNKKLYVKFFKKEFLKKKMEIISTHQTETFLLLRGISFVDFKNWNKYDGPCFLTCYRKELL